MATGGACASTSAQPAFKDVAQAVETRSGHKVRWNQDTEADKEAEQAIDRLLAGDLTADAAVQVALLNNLALRGKFEELAIAQADLVQAGLPPLCQRDVRQLSLDISVPMGGEWFPVRAQAFPDSRA